MTNVDTLFKYLSKVITDIMLLTSKMSPTAEQMKAAILTGTTAYISAIEVGIPRQRALKAAEAVAKGIIPAANALSSFLQRRQMEGETAFPKEQSIALLGQLLRKIVGNAMGDAQKEQIQQVKNAVISSFLSLYNIRPEARQVQGFGLKGGAGGELGLLAPFELLTAASQQRIGPVSEPMFALQETIDSVKQQMHGPKLASFFGPSSLAKFLENEEANKQPDLEVPLSQKVTMQGGPIIKVDEPAPKQGEQSAISTALNQDVEVTPSMWASITDTISKAWNDPSEAASDLLSNTINTIVKTGVKTTEKVANELLGESGEEIFVEEDGDVGYFGTRPIKDFVMDDSYATAFKNFQRMHPQSKTTFDIFRKLANVQDYLQTPANFERWVEEGDPLRLSVYREPILHYMKYMNQLRYGKNTFALWLANLYDTFRIDHATWSNIGKACFSGLKTILGLGTGLFNMYLISKLPEKFRPIAAEAIKQIQDIPKEAAEMKDAEHKQRAARLIEEDENAVRAMQKAKDILIEAAELGASALAPGAATAVKTGMEALSKTQKKGGSPASERKKPRKKEGDDDDDDEEDNNVEKNKSNLDKNKQKQDENNPVTLKQLVDLISDAAKTKKNGKIRVQPQRPSTNADITRRVQSEAQQSLFLNRRNLGKAIGLLDTGLSSLIPKNMRAKRALRELRESKTPEQLLAKNESKHQKKIASAIDKIWMDEMEESLKNERDEKAETKRIKREEASLDRAEARKEKQKQKEKYEKELEEMRKPVRNVNPLFLEQGETVSKIAPKNRKAEKPKTNMTDNPRKTKTVSLKGVLPVRRTTIPLPYQPRLHPPRNIALQRSEKKKKKKKSPKKRKVTSTSPLPLKRYKH